MHSYNCCVEIISLFYSYSILFDLYFFMFSVLYTFYITQLYTICDILSIAPLQSEFGLLTALTYLRMDRNYLTGASVCTYVCTSICTSLCISVRICVCTSVCICVCTSVCICVCTSVCTSVCISVCICVCTSLYICLQKCSVLCIIMSMNMITCTRERDIVIFYILNSSFAICLDI